MKAQKIEMAVCAMRSPSDTGAVEELFETGRIRPESVIAMVGKTEGTGLHNDYGRELAHLSLSETLARHLGAERRVVGERVTMMRRPSCKNARLRNLETCGSSATIGCSVVIALLYQKFSS